MMLPMKRLLAFLLILILSFSSISAFGEEVPEVYSYDFDLLFHMNADVFPARTRSHMQGYADLLNMLELKGNITCQPAAKSVDLNATVIPVTNPDAAISFRLYGIPEHMGLTSPLLGDETLWFQNLVLMEFAYKTWNNLRIPLQYATLLYPYVTENAFSGMAAAFSSRFGNIQKSRNVTAKELKSLSQDWAEVLRFDSRLKYWIYSLSLPAEKGYVMETEFNRLPEYLLNQLSGGKNLKVTVSGPSVTWTNAQKEVLFTRTESDSESEWALTLPATENGYLPRLSWKTSLLNNLWSLDLNGSYSLPEDSEETDLPESLLSLSLDMNNWPAAWPMAASFDAELAIGGIIYPNTEMIFHGESREDGSFSIRLSQPVDESGKNVAEVLSISGSCVPVAPSSVPSYSLDDFSSCIAIFNVNDKTMDDFVHRIRRPLFFGILNFLDELPVSSCQSVMDDLEDYGVLDMVLVD